MLNCKECGAPDDENCYEGCSSWELAEKELKPTIRVTRTGRDQSLYQATVNKDGKMISYGWGPTFFSAVGKAVCETGIIDSLFNLENLTNPDRGNDREREECPL